MGKCQPLYCICGCTIPQRTVAILLCSMGIIVAYGQRANINVAITRMISHEIRNLSRGCPSNLTDEEPMEGGTEHWTEKIQGFILGSFYIGYLIGQVPAGIVADKWGPRWVFAIGTIASSVLSILTPLVIRYLHWGYVVASRILTGIAQSTVFPCVSIFISRWVPFEERSTLGSFTYSSVSLGIILGNLVSGAIMYYMNNWPNVFYFWGILGLFWVIIFLLYVYSDFLTHPHLPEREKAFLTERIVRLTRLKIPYGRILTDRGIIALIIGQVGHDTTLFLCLTNIPKYLTDVLRMSVRDVSLVSALPFIGTWLCGIISGKICDYIAIHTNFSLKWNRGISTYLSFAVTNTFLVLMTYAGCHVPVAVVCYTIAVIFIGTFCAGHKVNQMDITVNFNGFVMSIINGGGCSTGFVTPMVIAYIAHNNEVWQWRIVGWLIFMVGFVTTTYYLFLLQVDRAEWDVAEDEKEEWTKQRDARLAAKEKEAADKKALKAAKKEAKGQPSKSL